MKPREFWIIPPGRDMFDHPGSVALVKDEYTDQAQKECIHVREVVPVDLNKGCLSYRIAKAVCKLAPNLDFEELQETIEKQLLGEE